MLFKVKLLHLLVKKKKLTSDQWTGATPLYTKQLQVTWRFSLSTDYSWGLSCLVQTYKTICTTKYCIVTEGNLTSTNIQSVEEDNDRGLAIKPCKNKKNVSKVLIMSPLQTRLKCHIAWRDWYQTFLVFSYIMYSLNIHLNIIGRGTLFKVTLAPVRINKLSHTCHNEFLQFVGSNQHCQWDQKNPPKNTALRYSPTCWTTAAQWLTLCSLSAGATCCWYSKYINNVTQLCLYAQMHGVAW